jgi:hypothetical protein
MTEPITLESLEAQEYTQKRIQDENVKYGLARCSRECKQKSIAKLHNFLSTHNARAPSNDICKILLDEDKPLHYVYPVGKTKDDFVAYVYNFFNGKP